MMKKVFSGCFAVFLLLFTKNVLAASTCDYSEQVSLNNAASLVQANYDIRRVVIDVNGFIVPDMLPEEVQEDDEYAFITTMKVQLLNITNDVYVYIKGDNGFEKTYYYSDTNNGMIEFEGGDLSNIVNYKITVYSNSSNCKGDVLRNIDLVTPMINPFSYNIACYLMPNYEYCKEYITSPFLISDDEVMLRISNEYQKYQTTQEEVTENKGEKSFLDNVRDFYENHKIIIFSGIGILVVIGALVTVVIIRKQRSRIL